MKVQFLNTAEPCWYTFQAIELHPCCEEVTLFNGLSKYYDDRDSESVNKPMKMRLFISYCHDMILSAGCSIDDRVTVELHGQ